VPDGTIEAIDRFFDLVDHGVDHVDRVLNRGKQTAARQHARKRDRSEVIDTSGSPAPAPKPSKPPTAPAASTMALTRKPRFYIVEAITPAGITEFVVTDGGNARTVCPSRAFAEQILHALEKSP
jgi:hypothetical protein